jgi:hypothetical protein
MEINFTGFLDKLDHVALCPGLIKMGVGDTENTSFRKAVNKI